MNFGFHFTKNGIRFYTPDEFQTGGYNPEENERISDSTLQEVICRSVMQTTSGQIRIDCRSEIFARIEIG